EDSVLRYERSPHPPARAETPRDAGPAPPGPWRRASRPHPWRSRLQRGATLGRVEPGGLLLVRARNTKDGHVVVSLADDGEARRHAVPGAARGDAEHRAAARDV